MGENERATYYDVGFRHGELKAMVKVRRLCSVLRTFAMRRTEDGWLECGICEGKRRLTDAEIETGCRFDPESHTADCILAVPPAAPVHVGQDEYARAKETVIEVTGQDEPKEGSDVRG